MHAQLGNHTDIDLIEKNVISSTASFVSHNPTDSIFISRTDVIRGVYVRTWQKLQPTYPRIVLYDCRCLHVFVVRPLATSPPTDLSINQDSFPQLPPSCRPICSVNHYLSARFSDLLDTNPTVNVLYFESGFRSHIYVIAACAHANLQIRRSPREQIRFKDSSWQELLPSSCFHTSFLHDSSFCRTLMRHHGLTDLHDH